MYKGLTSIVYTVLCESNYAGYSQKARDGGSVFLLHDVSQDGYIPNVYSLFRISKKNKKFNIKKIIKDVFFVQNINSYKIIF